MYRIVAALAGAAMALAACSSSSDSGSTPGGAAAGVSASVRATTPGGCHADIVPMVCVTVSITGASSVSGTAVTEAPAPPDASPKTTCAELASWKDTEHDLGGRIAQLGGHTVQWDEDLGHYHGPGTYDLTSSDFYVTVDNVGYDAYHDQSASVTVRPDYSVAYTFQGLTNEAKKVSGTLRWTCLDPT